jgi:hypothetical protein
MDVSSRIGLSALGFTGRRLESPLHLLAALARRSVDRRTLEEACRDAGFSRVTMTSALGFLVTTSHWSGELLLLGIGGFPFGLRRGRVGKYITVSKTPRDDRGRGDAPSKA